MKKNKSIRGDILKYLPSIALPAIISFFSVPIFTRIFSPELYGDLNIVRVTISILTQISGWVGLSIVRYYAEYEKSGELKVLISTSLKANVIIGCFVLIISTFILYILDLNKHLFILFEIGIVLFSFSLIFTTIQNILRSARRANMYSIFSGLLSLFSFIFALGLIYIYKLGIESIFLGQLIVTALLILPAWYFTSRGLFSFKSKIDWILLQKLFNYGMPLAFGTIGIWVLNLSDRYVINIILDNKAVGVYSSIYNITWSGLYMIVTAFYLMEQPIFMEIYKEDDIKKVKEFLNKNTRLYLNIIIPASIGFIVISKDFFHFFLDNRYWEGIMIVPYVAVTVGIIGIIQKYTLILLKKDKTILIFKITIFCGIVNILLNIILIPIMGIIAAAFTTLIAYSLYLVIIYIKASKYLKWIFPIQLLIKLTLFSVLASLPYIIFIKTNNLSIKMTLVIFGLIIYIIFIFTSKDYKYIRSSK